MVRKFGRSKGGSSSGSSSKYGNTNAYTSITSIKPELEAKNTVSSAREYEKAAEKEIQELREQEEKQSRKSVIPEEVPPPTPGPSQEELIRKAREQASQQPENTAQDPLSSATPVGSVKGVEAYRLPSQTISDRGQNRSSGKVPVDQDPRKSSVNPNFKPRR